MPCIKTIVANHFKVLFWDVLNQAVDKVQGRECFNNKFFILMAVVMKGDGIAIVSINAGSGNGRATEIATDIFGDSIGVAKIGFGINIKAVPAVSIAKSFHFFKRGTKLLMK